MQKDGLRIERDDEEAEMVHQTIEKTYLNFGYSPIKVPVMPVIERTNFIFNQLNLEYLSRALNHD